MIESCRERLDRGERVDFEAEAAARPQLAARLRPAFALLARLDRAFPAPPAAPLVGAVLGPWRVTSRLGGGGMGEVFACEDAGGAIAAVKVIHTHLLARPGFLDRFRREALLGRRIRHDNVVATLDAADWDAAGATRHCLVMEYVEGQTLRAMLDDLGYRETVQPDGLVRPGSHGLPEDLCRHVGREIAKGLAAIHAAGVVHRDLKPDNVIVTREHVVKVMDLGVARLVDEAARLSQSAAFIGSFHYAAPEQFGFRPAAGAEEATPRSPVRAKGGQSSRDVDCRADLFALGLVLYELATGAHPFEADDIATVVRNVLHTVPRPAGELNPQLSPFFEELVARLLEKDRDKRPASAEDVVRILDEGEDGAWWRERSAAIRAQTHRPLRRIRIPRETAVYGRDSELALLRSLFEKASAGDGQVAVIEGEAGIGKSRLVDEFVGRLAQSGEDVNFLYGSYPPGGAATASGAFSTAYREQLGDDEASVRAALPQTPLLAPAFAALLRGDVPPDDAEKLTKASLQTVFVHATRSFAAERPTIVLIDDLHFAPDEGRALFASLALAVPGHRILLVGCSRRGLDEKWVAQMDRLDHATRLALPRLSPNDLVRLLADSLHSERLAEDLAGKIAAKSDGNPFFVFEILRGLRDGQFLTKKPDGTWATTKLIAEIEVPGTVKDLIFARVGGLATEARNLLDVAACAGFDFDPVLVGEVLHVGRIPVLQRLAAVEKSHRLVRSVGRRFVFDHHQVAEVLYAALPEMLREEYHAAIGAAIEAKSGAASKEPKDLDGALCADLAEHFLRGAQGERAIRYLRAALDHLEKGYLNDAAVRLADRALAVPGLVAGAERVSTLLRLCELFDLLGRRDRQEEASREAAQLADSAGDAEQGGLAARVLGSVFQSTSRNAEAESSFRRALEIARTRGDKQQEAAVENSLGIVFYAQTRLAEAREHYERALALKREIGDRAGESGSTINMGNVLWSQGRHAEAREHYERGLALCREFGRRRFEANATVGLGNVLWSQGRQAEAREQLERGIAIFREVGERRGEAAGWGDLASILAGQGHLGEAREHFERYLALCREIGDRARESVATLNLGCVSLSLGRLAQAHEHADRAIALAREVGDRRVEGFAVRSRADVAAEEGDFNEAERLFTEALELRRAIGQRDGVAITLEARGALLSSIGRADEARADLDAALAIARELSLPGVELLAAARLATLPGGDAAAALAALEDHAEMPEAMPARFLLWQATRDPVHLAEAKRRLDFFVEHAPPDCRESMLANVRLHREIAAAAREQGLPLAADSPRAGDERSAGSADA